MHHRHADAFSAAYHYTVLHFARIFVAQLEKLDEPFAPFFPLANYLKTNLRIGCDNALCRFYAELEVIVH